MGNEGSWTEDYYDAMTHYAWAPEDLDHLSNSERKRKSPYQTVARLRKLEVPFNHILAIFFSLAPAEFVAELFQSHCDVDELTTVNHLGRDFEREEKIDLITQPDFVFENEHAFLTIETKLNSKSSLEQLQKYAYLHHLIREKKKGRQHALLYLTPHDEARLFPGKLQSIDEARKVAAQKLRSGDPAKWTLRKVATASKVADLLDETPPSFKTGHCRFEDFSGLVRRYRDLSEERSVERRLFDGLLGELERRELAPKSESLHG